MTVSKQRVKVLNVLEFHFYRNQEFDTKIFVIIQSIIILRLPNFKAQNTD